MSRNIDQHTDFNITARTVSYMKTEINLLGRTVGWMP